jgi:predicted HTH transcriptional regulator
LIVSRITVIKVVDEDAKERAVYPKSVPKVRTETHVAKMKKAMTGTNSLSRIELAKELQISARTIRRVIRLDLETILKKY